VKPTGKGACNSSDAFGATRIIVVLAKSDLIDNLEIVIYHSVPIRAPFVRSLTRGFRFLPEPRRFNWRSWPSAINSAFLQRSVKRPKLTPSDRLLWAWLCVA
jgi:hypothetical protein